MNELRRRCYHCGEKFATIPALMAHLSVHKEKGTNNIKVVDDEKQDEK